MRGKRKAVISMALAASMIMSLSTVALADTESKVSVTQDNITVTKSAEWVKVDGSAKDASGNPYAQINFKVDTTNATTDITNTVSKGGPTDVMLVLDKSGSMAANAKMENAKKGACDFVDSVTGITTDQVKVGLVTFDSSAKKVATLTTDKDTIKNSINSMKANGCTAMAAAIKEATREFTTNSTATNKIMVVLGDGYPDSRSVTIDAAAVAKRAGIKIVTIGYECNEVLLKEIASEGANNKKMYYKAAVTATNVVKDLGTTFVEISERVTSTVVGNNLIDKIPTEFDVVDGTIKSNDGNVVGTLSDDKKTITWSWGSNKLEKKVYEMSVVVKLDMSKVPADYITNKSDIFTNGTSIKTDVDSSASAVFGYGETGVINLKSPKLSLADIGKSDATSNGTTDSTDNKTLTGTGIIDSSPKTGDSFGLVTVIIILGAGIVLAGSGVALKKRSR